MDLLLSSMQPQKISCSNCGAELLPEGRFCRKCGQPSNPLGRPSITEDTTRRLEKNADPFMGQNQPGQPANLEPTIRLQGGQSLSAQTRSLEPAQSTKKWIPALVLLCIFILLPTIFLLRYWRQPTVIIPTPPTTGPAVPKPPKPPAVPPAPSSPIDQSLIYPNARTTMVVSKAGEGNVVQLETEEALEKVTNWYKDRLKPTEIVQRPGNVILKSDEATAIITANGNGTNIMIKQGAD